MSSDFRLNAQDIQNEAPFSRATINTIAKAQLVDQPDGGVALVTDPVGFSLLIGQFEAMQGRGFGSVMRSENYAPGCKALIFQEEDAPVVRRIHQQAQEFHLAYMKTLEQRGGRAQAVWRSGPTRSI